MPEVHLSMNKVQQAIDKLIDAQRLLCLAAGYVAETPEDDRIMSFANDLEELELQLKKQLKRLEEMP